MAIIAQGVLSNRIQKVKENRDAFREEIQEILVSCAYQAAMGNPNYANELLEAVRDTVNIRGITLWLETYAPLVVRKDAFAINKGMRKTMSIESEADFAPYEVEMRKVKWWQMAPEQRAKSMFDPSEYLSGGLERMAKNLNKEGYPDLANEVKALIRAMASSSAYKAAVEAHDAKAKAEA